VHYCIENGMTAGWEMVNVAMGARQPEIPAAQIAIEWGSCGVPSVGVTHSFFNLNKFS
jgi:hypothetical protein